MKFKFDVTPVFYTVATLGVLYYLERKKNVPVLDDIGIIAEKCIGTIRGLFSKVVEDKKKEKVEYVPENDKKEDFLETIKTKIISTSLTSDPIKEKVTGLEVVADLLRGNEQTNESETDQCKRDPCNDAFKKEQKMTRKSSLIKPIRTDEATKSWLRKLDNLN